MYALIRQWEASGQSQGQFSFQHGLAKSTFSYWRKKYLKETARSQGDDRFIPVKVDLPVQGTDQPARTLELVYPNGVRMVCSEGMDLSRLKPLIVL